MIRLLALDLDGTLLNSKGEVSEANLTAIRAAEERGVLVTIATGRRFRDAQPVAIKSELNAPILTHNGALAKYAESLEVVNATLLPNEAARKVLEIGDFFGVDAMLSCNPIDKGVLLYDNISPDNLPLQKYIAWSKRINGGGVEAEESVRHVESLREAVGDVETIHVAFSGSCAKMTELQTILNTELAGQIKVLATVYTSLDFTLLDILHPNASKGHGVKNLADLNGIAAAEIMTMGDNFNDVEMLDYAGTPVVMGNAEPELLENPRYNQTLSNDENGVALAIDRFILEK